MGAFRLWIDSLDVDLVDDLLPHPRDHRLALCWWSVGCFLWPGLFSLWYECPACQMCSRSLLRSGRSPPRASWKHLVHRQEGIEIDSTLGLLLKASTISGFRPRLRSVFRPFPFVQARRCRDSPLACPSNSSTGCASLSCWWFNFSLQAASSRSICLFTSATVQHSVSVRCR